MRGFDALKKRLLEKEFVKNNKANLTLTVGFSFMISAIQITISIIMMEIIDSTTAGNFDNVLKIACTSIALIFAYIIIFNLWSRFKNKFIRNAVSQYKENYFRKLFEQKIWFYDENDTSVTLSGLTNDISKIESNYLENIHQVIRLGMLFILGIVAMVCLNTTMFLVVSVISLIPVFLTLLTGNMIKTGTINVSNENSKFVAGLKDFLNGFSIIKLCFAEKNVKKIFNKSNYNLEHSKEKLNNTIALVESLSTVSGIFVLISVFIIGSLLCMRSVISVGVIIAYVQLLNYILTPIQTIPLMFNEIKAIKSLINKNEDLLIETKENAKNSLCHSCLTKEIVLKNVSCSYGKNNVLSNISYTFKKGKSYAIVGKSGCGKSTLLKLLLGYFDKYQGNVLVDECEITEVAENSLYKLFSVIQQNVMIFNASLKDNITMFKDTEDKFITRAIEMSGLSELVSKVGMEYICGENGNRLSGGEKQRISIARSILNNVSVLLMDEATSSLDNQNAHQIEKTIANLKDITKIAITHRIDETTLKNYDEIIVMKEGKIVEHGSFKELIEFNNEFASLYESISEEELKT